MPIIATVIIGVILALGATVCLFIFILPDKKRDKLPGFFKVVHDILNVKTLLIEKVLKALYVFNTMLCLFVGFFGLFSGTWSTSFWTGRTSFQSFAPYALLLIVFGPIVCRLLHEVAIMMILLVKNTMEINQKLKSQNGDVTNPFEVSFPKKEAKPVPASPEAPVVPAAEAKEEKAEAPAETKAEGKFCPECGAKNTENAVFCASCGHKFE